jgi:hypothetical protein
MLGRGKTEIRNESATAAGPRPRFRETAPVWARLTDKLAELTAREAELIEQLRPLNERLARTGQFEAGFGHIKPKRDDAPVAEIDHSPAVKKLLGDLAPPPLAPVQFRITEGPDKAKWREISDELDSVRSAIGVIHEPLKKAWLAGSADYCQHISPDYRAVAASVCASLIALGHAMVAHEKFAKDLREQGVAWGMLRPMAVSALGSPLHADSEFSRVLKWAVECGHLHADDIPPEWAPHRS